MLCRPHPKNVLCLHNNSSVTDIHIYIHHFVCVCVSVCLSAKLAATHLIYVSQLSYQRIVFFMAYINHVALAKNALFSSYGIICLLRPPSSPPDELSMAKVNTNGFCSQWRRRMFFYRGAPSTWVLQIDELIFTTCTVAVKKKVPVLVIARTSWGTPYNSHTVLRTTP